MTYYLKGITEEEMEACMAFLAERREKEEKENAYQKNLKDLHDYAMSMIDAIGLPKTKQIFRQVTRELRDCVD